MASQTEVHKKLVNLPERAVDDAVDGFVALNSGLRRLSEYRVIFRADIEEVKQKEVTIISGGGSGHEPAHAGYVGPGLLSAAVAGDIFASPSPASILAAIRVVCGKPGTLLVVKSYTGDRLNFGIALEHAKSEGYRVDMVIVGEDCALKREKRKAGRRGLAGTVFVHKLVGAAAQAGKPLEEIVKIAQEAANDMGTMGVALSPCSLPGKAPSFTLGPDQMELGLGIHGEAGSKRTKLEKADEVVKTLIDYITCPENKYLSISEGDRVAVMINNLGGTSSLELSIVAHAALGYLVKQKKVKVECVSVGPFMTSLEMAGVSVTLLKLNDLRKSLIQQPTSAPAWSCVCGPTLFVSSTPAPQPPSSIQFKQSSEALSSIGQKLKNGAQAGAKAVADAEPRLTDLDRIVGDGDCGTTLKQGAEAILAALTPPGERGSDSVISRLGLPADFGLPFNNPVACLLAIAELCQRSMGGTSGALYRIFFSSISSCLAEHQNFSDPLSWAKAFQAGWQAISKYGGATKGDRTMLDAGLAASEYLLQAIQQGEDSIKAFQKAAERAQEGADSTARMEAGAGRSSYINSGVIEGTPDPGAVAVAIWMKAASAAVAATK